MRISRLFYERLQTVGKTNGKFPNNAPNIQPELSPYRSFCPDLASRLFTDSCEDYRRDVNEYAMTREAIGYARGITIGKVKQTIDLLILWLERIVASPTKEIRSQIESITDLDQVNLIFDKVLMQEIRTLEDLEPYLSSNDHGK